MITDTAHQRSLEEAQKLFQDLLQGTQNSPDEFWWVATSEKGVISLKCMHRNEIAGAQDRLVQFLRDSEASVSAAPHFDAALEDADGFDE